MSKAQKISAPDSVVPRCNAWSAVRDHDEDARWGWGQAGEERESEGEGAEKNDHHGPPAWRVEDIWLVFLQNK